MKFQTEYANLILKKGVTLKEKQNLYIKTGPDTYSFAALLAERAYGFGAGYVHIDIQDYRVIAARLSHQSLDESAFLPDFNQAMLHELLQSDWAYIRIHNTEDETYLEKVPAEKLSSYNAAQRTANHFFYDSLMHHDHAWCVVCYPGDSWAKKVLGPSAGASQLWSKMIPILKLDSDDPVAAWESFGNTLQQRGTSLSEKAISELTITGPGTDITIGIPQHAKWIGGMTALPDGREFFPNLPTEELFTTPDYRRVSGTVTSSMPFSIFNRQVSRVQLRYELGKLVEFSGGDDEETQLLREYFSIDEGSSRLGEIALVDQKSAIAASGLLFHNTLYDENAACHIALGAGYPNCLPDLDGISEREKILDSGCNISVVHTDMMIGSDSLSITAILQDGSSFEIMRNGSFCFGK